ncbi:hypothetical protein EVAR_57051_1 [Eumeta japonica]|uniref:Uncharacterized protein n=1 Tax=Eumeta variegata TaxID=151549 RepID=A0A4C1YN45_EUMVA|nr:hypothetical protein EVAR_57051_1 [Eumeta japonica]
MQLESFAPATHRRRGRRNATVVHEKFSVSRPETESKAELQSESEMRKADYENGINIRILIMRWSDIRDEGIHSISTLAEPRPKASLK